MNCPFLSYTPRFQQDGVTSDASATSNGSSTTDVAPFPSQRVVCFYSELAAIERVGVEPLHGVRRAGVDRAQERTVDIEANGLNRPASRRLDLRDDADRADGAGAAERRRDPHVHIVADGRGSSPGRAHHQRDERQSDGPGEMLHGRRSIGAFRGPSASVVALSERACSARARAIRPRGCDRLTASKHTRASL